MSKDEREVILETKNISRYFGALKAVDSVNFKLYKGESHAIIGPNGAGKSTFMDLIINRTTLSEGQVFFEGKDITRMKPHHIANLGISKCFQISQLFPSMSCFENVRVVLIKQKKQFYSMLPKKYGFMREECRQILDMVGMADKMDDIASFLSYGDQRRLEIALALAMKPKLLFLDEPTAGVARAEGYAIMKMIQNLAKEEDLTVLFIEHDMDIVFNYADRISVLGHGALLATDIPDKIRENKFVQEAYFGEKKEAAV